MTPARQKTAKVRVGQIVLALALLLLWEAVARHVGPRVLSVPADVLARLGTIIVSGDLWSHLGSTIYASLAGTLIGGGIGALLPFLLYRSARATDAVEPYVMASIGVPKFTLAPLLIFWFGIGFMPKIAIVALAVYYVAFTQIFAGIRAVDPRLVDMARVAGASARTISRHVVWPSLAPFFLTSLKIILPRAVGAAIVAEILIGGSGLGYYIERSLQTGDVVGLFTGVLVVIVFMLLLNLFLEAMKKRLLSWQAHDREMDL